MDKLKSLGSFAGSLLTLGWTVAVLVAVVLWSVLTLVLSVAVSLVVGVLNLALEGVPLPNEEDVYQP